jgi:hypothetical protein
LNNSLAPPLYRLKPLKTAGIWRSLAPNWRARSSCSSRSSPLFRRSAPERSAVDLAGPRR